MVSNAIARARINGTCYIFISYKKHETPGKLTSILSSFTIFDMRFLALLILPASVVLAQKVCNRCSLRRCVPLTVV